MIGRSENTCVAAVLMLCLTAPLTSPQRASGQDVTDPLYESRFVEANGIRLQYMDFGGSGLPLIFVQDIHNYFEHEELFFIRDLQSAFYTRFTDDHRVLATVKRGYGESDDPGWGYDVATHSEDLLGLMDALGIRRAVLVGRAPATQDLTWIAEHHPERVAGLVYLGNPVVIRSSQHPEARLFDENYARGSCDLEEPGIALVGARTSWRPHFLDDETVHIDVPSLRFTHPVWNRRSMDLQRLDRLDAIAAEEPGCPGHAQSLEYFQALAADPARRAALREALEASDLSVPIDEGIERAFGASMRTVVDPDPWEGGLPAFHDFIEPHVRSFLAEVAAGQVDDPETVHVAAPTGVQADDRASILDALEQVQPGGTIQFAPGTYLIGEMIPVAIPQVTLLGHPEGTTLRGCDLAGYEEMQRDADQARDWSARWAAMSRCGILELTGGRATVRNLTFEYTNRGLGLGCCLAEPAFRPSDGGYVIEYNTFRNSRNGIRASLASADTTVVRRNRFINVYHAVSAAVSHFHVTNNDISVPEPEHVSGIGHPGFAIQLEPVPPGPGGTVSSRINVCEHNVIAGNRIEGHPDGIVLSARPGTRCRHNVIRDNTIAVRRVRLPASRPYVGPARIIREDDSTVVGVPLALFNDPVSWVDDDSAPPGIFEGNLIKGNHITGAEGLGIVVYRASRNRVVNNTIRGITVRDPYPGNTIGPYNGEGWDEANGSGIWLSPGSDGNEIVGNTFEDVAGAAVVLEGDSNRVETRSADDAVRDLGRGNRVMRTSRPAAYLEALYRARTDSARTRFSAADVRFVSGMIAHHAQAIVMSRLAPSRDASPAVRLLAGRIINAQEDEIALLQQWLRERGQPVPEVDLTLTTHGPAHAAHAHGMLTGEQLRALEAATAREFDRLFLESMIRHHLGAITMVDELFSTDAAARDPAVSRLASAIQADQAAEIVRMRRMLGELSLTGRIR